MLAVMNNYSYLCISNKAEKITKTLQHYESTAYPTRKGYQ